MKELSGEDFDRKLMQLETILRAWNRARTGGANIRELFHVASAFVAAGITAKVAMPIFQHFPNNTAWLLSVSLVGGVVGFMAFSRYAPAQRSDVEVLDDLMNEYEPVFEDAYANLQLSARRARALTSIDVPLWVHREQQKIRDLLPSPTGPGTKFMNKEIPPAKGNDDDDDLE